MTQYYLRILYLKLAILRLFPYAISAYFLRT